MRPGTNGRSRSMTAKEKLLERVMALSEAEADEALRLLDAHESEEGWGDLANVHEVAFSDPMQRLAKSERAAGHEPWFSGA
jgi:plasmid maintenance system killer protein